MEMKRTHRVQWLIQIHFEDFLEKEKLRFSRKHLCENSHVVICYNGVHWFSTFHLKEMLPQNVLIRNGTTQPMTKASLWSSLVSIRGQCRGAALFFQKKWYSDTAGSCLFLFLNCMGFNGLCIFADVWPNMLNIICFVRTELWALCIFIFFLVSVTCNFLFVLLWCFMLNWLWNFRLSNFLGTCCVCILKACFTDFTVLTTWSCLFVLQFWCDVQPDRIRLWAVFSVVCVCLLVGNFHSQFQ